MVGDALNTGMTELIRDLVETTLPDAGIIEIDAVVGEDHDGDEAIIVEIRYDSAKPDLDPKRVAKLMVALNNRLYEAGERRLAHLYNRTGSLQAASSSR